MLISNQRPGSVCADLLASYRRQVKIDNNTGTAILLYGRMMERFFELSTRHTPAGQPLRSRQEIAQFNQVVNNLANAPSGSQAYTQNRNQLLRMLGSNNDASALIDEWYRYATMPEVVQSLQERNARRNQSRR